MDTVNYPLDSFYDEMIDSNGQNIGTVYTKLFEKVKDIPIEEVKQRQYIAERVLLNEGIPKVQGYKGFSRLILSPE